jgi:cation diffusion facilitator CzcD-associated flavoprotein CzcO
LQAPADLNPDFYRDETADCKNKKVAVIGNGSSGVQVFTALQKEAASITHYIRSPTWISLNYMSQYTRNGDGQNFEYTDEEKSNFKHHPETFLAYRKKLEDTSIRLFKNLVFEETCKELKANFRKTLTSVMTERTKGQAGLAEKIIPTFQPWCRRLTPADGYLEALQALNANLVDTPIAAITPTGIRLEDGKETDYDVIVTATGFVNNRIAPWTMRGRNGVTMEELFKENPEAYLSICVPQLPNYFAIGCGPNFPVANGPVQSALSWICDYILRWTKKMTSEDIVSICVKQDVVEAYNIYIQEVFRRTVWNRECNSWYKTGRRDEYRTGISAIYPGSLHHFREMLECDLRGEDFNFTYGSRNKFKFLGNGLAEVDLNDDNDMAFHIDGAFRSENTI